MYADDITLWVNPRDAPRDTHTTIATVQKALDTLDRWLPATGMKPSPEKTAVLLIGGLPQLRAQVSLTLAGKPIHRPEERWIRILGVPIHEEGGVGEWLSQLQASWKQHLHLIRRIATRFGGAGLVTNWEAVSPCVPSMKKELLFAGPMGLFAFVSGCVFVDRENSERARETLNRRLEDVRSGKTSILIFAEGTRNEEPKLLPFKKGAFHMAVQCQVPIVPLVISRYSSFFSTKEKKFNAGHVRITALPEVNTEGMGPNDVADLASMVQDIMQTAIDNELTAEETRRFRGSYAAALSAS
ncbi:uncharacterized protein LOC115320245 [Ixodes scapularis]|uniref:uncharacterized protein LOC115320245 n=1 Tax=Ixodes scapularis TaxID=6945 RepID=UPI001C3895B2|nr:uncharacterized protein LOC115320245 [Ixodes scapularis]